MFGRRYDFNIAATVGAKLRAVRIFITAFWTKHLHPLLKIDSVVPNDGVEKVSSAYPAVYQMEYQAEILELAHSGSNDLKSSMTATTDNLTVLFSALPDAGDVLKRLSAQPAGMTAFNSFEPSLSTLC
jgi:hypothetical protein